MASHGLVGRSTGWRKASSTSLRALTGGGRFMEGDVIVAGIAWIKERVPAVMEMRR